MYYIYKYIFMEALFTPKVPLLYLFSALRSKRERQGLFEALERLSQAIRKGLFRGLPYH